MLEFSGIVTINTLNAITLEIESSIVQSNVLTKAFYKQWTSGVGSGSIISNVYISSVTSPSYEDWPLVTGCITDGFVPAGVTSPILVAAAGSTPAYAQFMRRFNPAASTRSINTVLLAQGTASILTSQITPAYVSLSVPCVQTTSQIIDVYYRIQATTVAGSSYNHYQPSPVNVLSSLTGIGGEPGASFTIPGIAGITPITSHVLSSSNTSPTTLGAMYALASNTLCTNVKGTTSIGSSVFYAYQAIWWSYTTAQGVGDLHGSLAISRGPLVGSANSAYTSVNLTAPNNSKIQPIFSHSSSTLALTSANPFLDSFPSAGSGTVSFDGTWTTNNLPELYKIDIVSGGATGTATYKFSKRNHFGFCGSSYISNWVSLPGAYNMTGSIKKTHMLGDSNANLANGYGVRMERYDNTHFISYDQTGVSRYNIINNSVEIWDSTTTPSLPATNIRQVSVNTSDGAIWVACVVTGIYCINSTGTTVTNFTTVNGLPSNQCWAIDIGRNNTIWALCTGAVISSADNGVTWTVYNTSTAPAFNAPVLTAEWSGVHYMRVDPFHVDDRMCFVRYAECTTNTTISMVWWSRGTGVAVNGPTTLGNGSVGYTYFRRAPSAFNVSNTDGIWAVILNAGAVAKLTYGTTTVTYLTATGTLPGVMFVRDAANTQDLLMALNTSVGGNLNLRAITLYNSAGTVVSLVIPPSVTTAGAGSNASDTCIYLGNGVIVIAVDCGNAFGKQGIAGEVLILPGDGTPTAGVLEYLTWEKYGWDGTNWVINHSGAKTTHTDSQLMLHGINAKFTDGAAGTSFIANDYYTGSVNDGILKNNAMTMSGSTAFYVLPTQLLTDFDGVIRLYPYTTGLVTWRKVSASLTVNVDMSLTNNIPYRSYSIGAGSQNRVFGDFSISGTITNTATQHYNVGIIASYLAESPTVRDNVYSTWYIQAAGTTISIRNSTDAIVSNVGGIGAPITWNISRVGSTISISTSGVVRYTTIDSTYSFCVRVRYTDITSGVSAFTVNPITVNSSGVGYYTGLGNSTTGTGIYNNKQFYTTIVNTSDVLIDGVALTTLNLTAATAPAVGGASHEIEAGLLFFNSSDVGKTVTGSYLATYQASTPCNIIPV